MLQQIDIPNITPIGSEKPISETLPLAIAHIASNLDPDQIILFGSYAYGIPNSNSDVDLLVVMNTMQTKSSDRTWQVAKLLIPRLFSVDIIVKTQKEITQALQNGNFFIKEIMTQGKIMYERSY